MSGPADPDVQAADDRQAQQWLAVLQTGTAAEKAVARRGLAGIFEARGLTAEAVELLVTNARDGHRDAELFRALARMYRVLGNEYLAASAALEATRLSRPPTGGRAPVAPRAPTQPASVASASRVSRQDRGSGMRGSAAVPAAFLRGRGSWHRAVRIAGWLAVLATLVAGAALAADHPASAALYLLSAASLAALLLGSRTVRRLTRLPDGPLGDGTLLFVWLLALLAAGAMLPRTMTIPRTPASQPGFATPGPTRAPSPAPAIATPPTVSPSPSPSP